MSKKRKWSAEEKLAIIKESENHGVVSTIRKHGIYAQTLYGWKQKYDLEGIQGLEHPYKRTNPEFKKLQMENLQLKQILADKELMLKIKDDLLKKTIARSKKSE